MTDETDSNGEFVFDLSTWVSYGSVTVNVQIGEGVWTQLTFEYSSV